MSDPMTGPSGATYAEAVDGWADHLRTGGTTPWSRWRPAPDSPAGAHVATPRTPLPDAAHLELLRRLNEHDGETPSGLVELVLTTPAPGRGRVDVPLPWTGPGVPRFGQPPVDPAALPEEELVRLAVGVLARILPEVPSPAPTPDLARWPAPWRRRFRLHGSPGTVAAVRRALLAQGLVETDWRPTHVVIGRPLPVMMAEHWAAGAVAGGVMRWGTLWDRARTRDSLPGQLDVERIAGRLARAGDPRREPVHLVLARDDATVAGDVATVLRTRSFEVHTGTDPARVDLLRRLNRHVGVVQGPGPVRRSARALAAVLDEGRPPLEADVPAPPRGALPWARRTADEAAARVHEGHRRAGYAVHGDPGLLVPSGSGSGSVDPRETLRQALWGCLESWRRREGST
jgi:hypothetical protein